MTTESPFVILDVPNKGQSVFAVRFIPAGTSLFQEPPIITVEDAQATAKIVSLNRAFSQLSAEQKTAYLSLCNSQPASDTALTEVDIAVLGIWKTNTFVLDDQGMINGIFQMSSRLNHSCLGGENAHWEWSEEEKLMRFWTDRDIEAGEEITHCYRPDWRMGTKNRREALMENYGFWCTCKVCESPEED
ncbi:SET domain-containing protein [Morchella conica CCBAS932]|uniref:SET domain-containing protein n=1 Tax=Morchella conica CCBAS932 TaxID=1392247 RepID=A0A3N4L037_9PEZI|nr:SET domain-containing protein [Morchella conica CCBAS932]